MKMYKSKNNVRFEFAAQGTMQGLFDSVFIITSLNYSIK